MNYTWTKHTYTYTYIPRRFHHIKEDIVGMGENDTILREDRTQESFSGWKAFQDFGTAKTAASTVFVHHDVGIEKREGQSFRYLGHVSSGPVGAFSRRERDTRIFVGQVRPTIHNQWNLYRRVHARLRAAIPTETRCPAAFKSPVISFRNSNPRGHVARLVRCVALRRIALRFLAVDTGLRRIFAPAPR